MQHGTFVSSIVSVDTHLVFQNVVSNYRVNSNLPAVICADLCLSSVCLVTEEVILEICTRNEYYIVREIV